MCCVGTTTRTASARSALARSAVSSTAAGNAIPEKRRSLPPPLRARFGEGALARPQCDGSAGVGRYNSERGTPRACAENADMLVSR